MRTQYVSLSRIPFYDARSICTRVQHSETILSVLECTTKIGI